MDGSLYPNDGRYFLPTEPNDQQKSRDSEANDVLSAIPVLNDILKRFEERIAFYGSVDSIEVDLEQDPATHQKLVEVGRLMKANLNQEKAIIEDLIKEYVTTL